MSMEKKRELAHKMCKGYVHIPTMYFRCNDCNIQMMMYEEDTTEPTESRPGKRCSRCNSNSLRVEII
jgi:uncharacterized protein with PIN domain